MSKYLRNRMHNASNPYQGTSKKVLCVCSAGLLRSPTVAWVLSQDPWNFNTRACGESEDFALIPIDPVLIAWADDIVVVEKGMFDTVRDICKEFDFIQPTTHVVETPDQYGYRDPYLVKVLRERLIEVFPIE